MQVQIIYRESHTEKLFFTTRPDYATRAALRLAGWRYDRNGCWWRNRQETGVIKPKELSPLLVPIQIEAAAG